MFFVIFFTAGDILFLLGLAAVGLFMAGSVTADIFTWITENSMVICMASTIIILIGAIVLYFVEKDLLLSWAIFANVPLLPVTIVLMIAKVIKDFRVDLFYGILAIIPNILITVALLGIITLLMVWGILGIGGFFSDGEDESPDAWRYIRSLIACAIQNVIIYNLFFSE